MAKMATRAMTSHRYTFESIPAGGAGVSVGSTVGAAVGVPDGFGVGVVEGLWADAGMKEELSLRMTIPPSSPDGMGVGVGSGVGEGVGVGETDKLRLASLSSLSIIKL